MFGTCLDLAPSVFRFSRLSWKVENDMSSMALYSFMAIYYYLYFPKLHSQT